MVVTYSQCSHYEFHVINEVLNGGKSEYKKNMIFYIYIPEGKLVISFKYD